MLGLVSLFFILLFFCAFGRLAVELLFGHRNVFLIKVSLILMALSAGVYYFLMKIQDWEIDHPGQALVEFPVALLFLAGVFLCGLFGFFWLRRLK